MDGIDLTIEEFEDIKKWQGWTDEEAQRWLDDQEPLPEVRWPDGLRKHAGCIHRHRLHGLR